MHYILHLRLQGFYIHALKQAHKGQPIVVHRDGKVVDANIAAQRLGYGVNKPFARRRGVIAIAYDPDVYQSLRREWLDICAEFADVIEPVEPHCAYLDLSEHPNPQAVADTLVRRLRDSLSLDVFAGTGNCRWTAKVASGMNCGTAPLVRPAAFVAGLSTAHMLSLSRSVRERLVRLGYRTVADVANVPLDTLRELFGDTGFEIFRAARGGGNPVVESRWPEGCLASRVSFDGIREVRELLDGLWEVACQMGETLQDRRLEGTEVQLSLEEADGRVFTMTRRSANPLRSVEDVYGCLEPMIVECEPAEVVGIRVRMPELVEARTPAPKPEMSKIDAFLGVRKAFGETATLLATQTPEPRRNLLQRLWGQSAAALGH